MALKLIGICLLAAVAAAPAVADVYKYRGADGHIYLTDRPMRGDVRLLKRYRFGSPAPKAGGWANYKKRKKALSPIISQVANETRIRPSLIHAVVLAESAYQKDAVSKKGAIGLMQLMPATASRYGVRDIHDPYENLKGGALYLRDLLKMFDQNLQLALAAYNAGENAVIRYGRRIPPYPETQNYVRKVIAYYRDNRRKG